MTPPSLDEIYEIVERRQVRARRRSRVAFTGTAVVMAAASVLGVRSLVGSQPTGSNPAAEGGEPTPTPTSVPEDVEPIDSLPSTSTTDPPSPETDSAPPQADSSPQPTDPVSSFHPGVFYGAGFGYSQAAALAEAWEQEDVWAAKASAGLLILAGDQAEVESLVGLPLGVDDRVDRFDVGQDQWEADFLHGAFLGAGYGAEQLDQLIDAWEIDFLTAKADAGYDILTGDIAELDRLIGRPPARP